MPSDVATVAAATAVLDVDLLTSANKRTRNTGNNRMLKGVALAGSAAIGDAAVDVFIDTAFVGRFYNTRTGFPNNDDLFALGGLGWPAGTSLQAVVVDAPATNPLNFLYAWDDL